MKKTFFIMAAFASLVALHPARAQSIGPSTLNAAGGGATISGNVFDWSIGEMVLVQTFTSTSIIVTQGVLQPSDGPVAVTGPSLASSLHVYPNPASSVVNVAYNAAASTTLTLRLVDMTGKVLSERAVPVKQGTITEPVSLNGYANATYMLEVSSGDGAAKEITSFKIQKIQ